jgi:hypothetical protein
MNVRAAVFGLVAVAAGSAGVAGAQVAPTSAPGVAAACGALNVKFDVSDGSAQTTSQPGGPQTGSAQVPEGKALVYLVEDFHKQPWGNPTVRIGVDGKWVGATTSETYLSFAVDPGVHHLCMSVQGLALYQLQKGITLQQLKAEAGKTYTLRVRFVAGRDTLPLVLVDAVDEDEGQFLIQTLSPVAWKVKK